MANPAALATFTPYKIGEGPVATAQTVTLKTNLLGDPIRFSINETLDNIVPSASLTILNATITELGETNIGIIGGVQTPEDESPWGKEVPEAEVEPNQFIYVAEIVGDYLEVDDGDGNLTYVAVGNGEVCTTHWRVVSVTMTTNEANIPICDISLEGVSKIAQEATVNAPDMALDYTGKYYATPIDTFTDNSIVVIEKNYLDAVYYYGEKYKTDDNYTSTVTLEEFIHNLQFGTDITTTVTTGTPATPYPNKVSLRYPPPSGYGTYMSDGDTVPGTSQHLTGIATIQTALGVSATGNYGPTTKAAVAAWQSDQYYHHGAKKLSPSAFGVFGPITWGYLFPGSTSTSSVTTHIPPPILLIIIEDYDTYCDFLFDRIKALGYDFTFEYNGVTYDTYNEMSDAHPWMKLSYIPLYTIYETADSVWEKITNIFAFNGLNIRFRRHNSFLVWSSSSMQVINPDTTIGGEVINIGTYGTGLSYTYTKEGVINKAHVKGWIGVEEGYTVQLVNYVPSLSAGTPYPNSVVVQYPPLAGYGTYMDDGDAGIDGVHTAQAKLRALGYKGANGVLLGHDGNFGPNTKFAVKTFQQKKNVKATPDGKLDSVTWDALFGQNMSSGMTRAQIYHEITAHITFVDDSATPVVYHDPLVISSGYETDTVVATYEWLLSILPEIYPSGINYTITNTTAQITWAEFTKWINAFIDTIKTDYYTNYWVPDSKKEHSVNAYSAVADDILNISGLAFNAVAQDFEVSADYLLSNEIQLKNWGEKEIYKTVMMARSGSYSSGGLPLRTEVGMQVIGYSELTGRTVILITSLSRTTDVQQQNVTTQISGNIVRSGTFIGEYMGKTVTLDGIVYAPEKYVTIDGTVV